MASLNSVTMRSAQRLRRVNSHGGTGCGFGCSCTGRDEGLATAFIGEWKGAWTGGQVQHINVHQSTAARREFVEPGNCQERPSPEKKPSAFLQKENGDFCVHKRDTRDNNIPHRFVSPTRS